MEKQTVEAVTIFASPEERVRLVHFCARMTKNRDVAEDLVQETLLEAWRSTHRLRDVERRQSWLFGIARNVCLRWLRSHRRDTAHLLPSHSDENLSPDELEDVLADDLDIEIMLERKELIELLDRAIGLLPSETRKAFIQRYVEESPLAEIASQLGTNASAVAMRLQRGKLVLRRLLAKEIDQDHPLYAVGNWEVTPLWCHSCGQQRLLGQRDPDEGKLLLKCPVCNPEADEIANKNFLSVLKGIKGYKPLYSRLAAWCDHYYRAGLRDGSAVCPGCGGATKVSITTPEHFPAWLRDKEMRMWMQQPAERVVAIPCANCRASCITSLEGLVLNAPAGQRFLKVHPRIRTLPRQYRETGGRAAILTSFESVTDTARLEIVSDYETYEVLHISGGAL